MPMSPGFGSCRRWAVRPAGCPIGISTEVDDVDRDRRRVCALRIITGPAVEVWSVCGPAVIASAELASNTVVASISGESSAGGGDTHAEVLLLACGRQAAGAWPLTGVVMPERLIQPSRRQISTVRRPNWAASYDPVLQAPQRHLLSRLLPPSSWASIGRA